MGIKLPSFTSILWPMNKIGPLMILMVLPLFGCGRKEEKETKEFRLLMQQAEPNKLPIKFKSCAFNNPELNSLKTSNFSVNGMNPTYRVYKIPANGDYLAALVLTRSECLIPYIRTYTLAGKLIDEVCITSGTCGYDCGYTCEEGTEIKEDFSFIFSDSITVMDCDSHALDLAPRIRSYITYQTGTIKPDGRIELSEKKRKPWTKNNRNAGD